MRVLRILYWFLVSLGTLGYASSADPHGSCLWTDCERLGGHVRGQSICNRYGTFLTFSRRISKGGCKRNTARRECCKTAHGNRRKWTTKCFSKTDNAVIGCSQEFGQRFVPTGKARFCAGRSEVRYECSG